MRTTDLRLTGHMGRGLSAFDTRWSAEMVSCLSLL